MYEIIKLDEKKHIFMDVSSFCTGYTISQIADNEAFILESGALWCPRDFENVDYYKMLYEFILKNIGNKQNFSSVIVEEFFQGASKGWGTSIVPKILACIELACRTANPELKYQAIPVSSWRAKLGIKKDPKLKGNQWKIPVKNKVESMLNYTFPEKVYDLTTSRPRNTPSDLWESVAICLAYLSSEPNNIKNFVLAENFIKQQKIVD